MLNMNRIQKSIIVLLFIILFLLLISLKNVSNAVDINSFELCKEELTIEKGKNGYLCIQDTSIKLSECTYYIEDTSIANISYISSYDDIYITALKNGDTNFYLTYGNVTKKCKIHVYTKPKSCKFEKEKYVEYLGSTTKIKINYSIDPNDCNCRTKFSMPYYNSANISSDGFLTLTKAGNYVITVETEYGEFFNKNISILEPYFNKSNYYIKYNNSYKLTLNGVNKNTKWSSSNSNVAKVDNNGNVKGLKVGTAIITADTNGYKASTKVTILYEDVDNESGIEYFYDINAYKRMVISEKDISLYPGKTKKLKIKNYENYSNPISWKSSNNKVAKVSKDGKVTAISPGKAYIYASFLDFTRKCEVVVKSPYISNKVSKIAIGQNYQLKLKGYTGKVKWESSNNKIVKVTSKGKIKGIKTGTATITATANGKKIKTKIKVKKNQITYKVDKDATEYRYGKPICMLSKVYYSGKNVVADVWIINTRSLYASKFDYIKIKLIDNNGKTIANKKFKNIYLNLHAFKSKKLTFKFTGSSVKNKKAVLINGVDMDYGYVYSYKFKN